MTANEHIVSICSDGILIDGVFHSFRWLGRRLYQLSEEDRSFAAALEETLRGIDDCLNKDDEAIIDSQSKRIS